MKVHLEMAEVQSCGAAACAYNVDQACHARAITVGNGVHPGCDTFLRSRRHVGDGSPHAVVGACKIASCRHNRDLECEAKKISVDVRGGQVECTTFSLVDD